MHAECEAYGLGFQLKCYLNNLSIDPTISTMKMSPREQCGSDPEQCGSVPKDLGTTKVPEKVTENKWFQSIGDPETNSIENPDPGTNAARDNTHGNTSATKKNSKGPAAKELKGTEKEGPMWSPLQQMPRGDVADFCARMPPIAQPEDRSGKPKYGEAYTARSNRGRRGYQNFPTTHQREVSDNLSDGDTHGVVTEEMYEQQKRKRKPILPMRAFARGSTSRLTSAALRE